LTIERGKPGEHCKNTESNLYRGRRPCQYSFCAGGAEIRRGARDGNRKFEDDARMEAAMGIRCIEVYDVTKLSGNQPGGEIGGCIAGAGICYAADIEGEGYGYVQG